ncbi:MAG: NAD(P)/FAD-dependent oxidoreductase [Gemmatimonadales bacterium]
MDRRRFVALTAAELSALAAAGCGPSRPPRITFPPPTPAPPPSGRTERFDIAVIGAGAFGGWTALHLREQGANVVLVDQYGPGNSRATSGDETRGVRTSYGDRNHGQLWMNWASQAMARWKRFDEEQREHIGGQLFFNTGDLIMREEPELFTTRTLEWWKAEGIEHEVVPVDEARRRWPVIDFTGITLVLHEPGAGVVRARRACEAVGFVFKLKGGQVRIGHAWMAEREGRKLQTIAFPNGDRIAADRFCFALGPWMPKMFPEVMGHLMNLPVGHVCYFGTPPEDNRFTYPNLPSWNFRGVTGWPALVPDNRGFRVRTGGERAFDPDLSQRVVPKESVERNRNVLRARFPIMANAPLSETRACHYESSTTRNFLIDHHPDFDNVILAGGGSAEGFKFGPVVGNYVAGRVLGNEGDPDLKEGFSFPVDEEPPPVDEE